MSFTQRVQDTKTRQYTYTRISRALLHMALGITKAETELQRSQGYISAIRILGFRKDAAPLLTALKKKASLPLVSKTAGSPYMSEKEIFYDQLYYAAQAQLISGTGPVLLKNEFERSPVIV